MGVIKAIKPIPKVYSQDHVSLESSLAKHGHYRNPGASSTKLPFKDPVTGKYRTGLDETAEFLQSWPEEERNAEIERIKETRQRLEEATGLDLSPKSKYYNFAKGDHEGRRITPVALGNKPVYFNMDDPMHEITWNWLRVHPTIAPSLQAYQTGQVHPQVVEFYVADDSVEDAVTFKKKQALNKAIRKLDELNEVPDKLRQIARLLDLPAGDNVSQVTVYNMVDNLLKSGEFMTGEHKGLNPITVFTELSELKEARAHVKDLVKQSIKANIYRVRNNGRLYQGDNEVAESTEVFVNYLLSDKAEAQEDLLLLEKKLKITKINGINDQGRSTTIQKPTEVK